MNESSPLLSTAGIAKSYGSVAALKSVDMAVRCGEIHALLGANGAGKSTLVKILSGVHPFDTGTMHVRGQSMIFRTPADALAAGIATVFQDPALIPDLTVEQNLHLSHTERGAFQHWFAWFGLGHLNLAELVRRLPLEILRMVDLARAVARDPHVLLLDEITAALTAEQAERVFALLAQWKAQGRSAVLITHRLAEVMRICDRATILRDGRNVALLETRAPAETATSSVPTGPPPETQDPMGDIREMNEHQLVEAMLGSPAEWHMRDDMENGPVQTGHTFHESAFAVQELGSRDIVRGVSFTVHRGEILGLVALEGQGQERLFALLSGDRSPDAGQILVNGRRHRFHSPYDAVQEGVVLVPGDRLLALMPNLSVHQNLVVTLFTRIRQWLGLPANERQQVRQAIEQLSIDTRAASQVRRLSGGNQQKVVIGRWLVAGFRILLCFDPTRGIDVHTKQEIYTLLRELAAQGTAILFYTSELAEIPLICDRVLVMHDGRIVGEQAAASATESSLLTAAHGLEVPA